MSDREELTLAEAAARYGITDSALRHAYRLGRLKARRIGGHTLVVEAAEVERYLASRPGGANRPYRRQQSPESPPDNT